MPVSGLLIVFFAYWGIKSYRLEQAFGQDRKIFMIWLWLGRIVSPLGIIWVFWTNL
jgi:SNF family Na+-dependent transporter